MSVLDADIALSTLEDALSFDSVLVALAGGEAAVFDDKRLSTFEPDALESLLE